MTYAFLAPFLKLLHLSANVWRGGRDEFSWKITRPGNSVGRPVAGKQGTSCPDTRSASQKNTKQGEGEEAAFRDNKDTGLARFRDEDRMLPIIMKEGWRGEEDQEEQAAEEEKIKAKSGGEGTEEEPEHVEAVPGTLQAIRAMQKLLAGDTPLKLPI
jgi:hypothetical protein